MSLSRVSRVGVGACQRLVVQQSVRGFRSSVVVNSGGGGGRPGGRPVLSWKEKRLLDERNKNSGESQVESSFDIGDTGSFEDLEKHYDLSTATVTELDDLENFQEPEALQAHMQERLAEEKKAKELVSRGKRRQKGPRSFVVPSMLFGSHKSEGYMIPSTKAPTKVRFSHKRVFGNKGKLASGDASE